MEEHDVAAVSADDREGGHAARPQLVTVKLGFPMENTVVTLVKQADRDATSSRLPGCSLAHWAATQTLAKRLTKLFA